MEDAGEDGQNHRFFVEDAEEDAETHSVFVEDAEILKESKSDFLSGPLKGQKTEITAFLFFISLLLLPIINLLTVGSLHQALGFFSECPCRCAQGASACRLYPIRRVHL